MSRGKKFKLGKTNRVGQQILSWVKKFESGKISSRRGNKFKSGKKIQVGQKILSRAKKFESDKNIQVRKKI